MADKLFLHICCAPCACWSVEFLRQKGFDVSGFWYNPNIHPLKEYGLRRQALVEYQVATGLDMVFDDGYDPGQWFEKTRPGWGAKDREARCSLCYRVRLERAVAEAGKRGFKKFSTTLLYSRYQFHDRIIAVCRRLSEEHGIGFVYFDLREGWGKGIEMSKKMGLYRQRYCGCLFSEMEAKPKKLSV